MQARYRLSWNDAHRRALRLIAEAVAIGLALNLTIRMWQAIAGWAA